MKKGIIISLFWGMGMATGMAQSVYPGICERQFRVSVQVPLAAESFDLQDVRLLPGRFRDNMMRGMDGLHRGRSAAAWFPDDRRGICRT